MKRLLSVLLAVFASAALPASAAESAAPSAPAGRVRFAKKPVSKEQAKKEQAKKEREKEERRLLRKTLLVPGAKGSMPKQLEDSGWAVFESRADGTRGRRVNEAEPTYARSLQRLMVFELVLARVRSGAIATNDVVTFSASAAAAASSNKEAGSSFFVAEGATATVDDLLRILARDPAPQVVVALAEHAARDHRAETFLADMDARARELNLRETKFLSLEGSRSVVDADRDRLFPTTSARDAAALFRQVLSRGGDRYLAPVPFSTGLGAKKGKPRALPAGGNAEAAALVPRCSALLFAPGSKANGTSALIAWKSGGQYRVVAVLGAPELLGAVLPFRDAAK